MGFFRKSEVTRHYDLGATFGSGNFATVKRATRKVTSSDVDIPKDVAIKIIDKAKVVDMADIRREIEIISSISHPGVVMLFEIFDEPKKMYLVMELVTGGELFDRIVARGSYTEADASAAVKALCEALRYLHSKQVVHRDLKPENILCEGPHENTTLKISDFGLARVVSRADMLRTGCGTPGYVAPELLTNRGYDDGAVDMWSLGVVLYIMLCGFPPFYEEELPALFATILQGRFEFPSPWWDQLSPESKDLVSKLLELNPNTRLTAAQVLSHRWHGAARRTPLPETVKSLKKYNASRKLTKAALGVVAQERMKQAMSGFTPDAKPYL